MNNTYFIVAAGPSYMAVTEDEWKFLEDKNTLTFARVPYGGRKFKYYMSIEREHLDKSVLSYMAELGYLDTKLLLSISQSINLAKQLGFKYIKQIIKENFYFLPSRRPWFADEEFPPHRFKESRAKSFREPIFRYRGQLSAAVNCALLLGANEIRLIGVDLNSQKKFYDYPEILDQVCNNKKIVKEYNEYNNNEAARMNMKKKKDSCEEFDESIMHTTDMQYMEPEKWGNKKLRGISDVLQWMDSEIREEGMNGIFITNKTSLLYKRNKLKYRSIEDSE